MAERDLVLRELTPGVTVDEARAKTAAPLVVAEKLGTHPAAVG